MQVLLSELDTKVGSFEFRTANNFTVIMAERPLL